MKQFKNLILAGALVLGLAGFAVSCDKYGDDIDELRDKVNTLASKDELSSQIASLQSALSAASAEASQASAEAATAKAAADKAAADAKSAGDAAAAAAAEANAAKAAADKAAADAKQAAIEALQSELETLKADLKKATDAQLAEFEKKVNAATEKVEALIGKVAGMVTSVELVYSYSDQVADHGTNLLFTVITEKDNVFGKGLKGEITFKAGAQYKTTPSFIVRVSPANAELTPDMISLVNSQNGTLDDLLDLKVKKYDKLLTKAEGDNALWEITASLKKDYDKATFNAATQSKGRNILFAVKVNNTKDDAEERDVYSSYDITLNAGSFKPYDELNYSVEDDVNGYYVANLNNRYAPKDASGNRNKSLLQDVNANALAPEYTWKVGYSNIPVPAVAPITQGANANVVKDVNDDRSDKNVFPAVQGEPIYIEVLDQDGYYADIRALYVTLDKANAVESAPSELNAWESYDYEGLNEVVEGTYTTITINGDETINDYIGFRVYAVNYDGTLVDPDGKAFYVNLGKPGVDWNAAATTVVPKGNPKVSGNEASATQSGKVDVKLTKLSGAKTLKWITADGSYYTNPEPNFHAYFVNASGTVLFSTDETYNSNYSIDLSKVDFTKVTKVYTIPITKTSDPEADWRSYEDGKAYIGYLDILDNNGHVLASMVITMTKNLPSGAPAGFSEKTGQIVGGVYNCYLTPYNSSAISWKVATANEGHIDLNNVFNGLGEYYTVTFAKTDGDKAQDVDKKDDNFILKVKSDKIDNTTSHASTVTYNYGKISSANYTVDSTDPNNVKTNYSDVIRTALEFQTIYNDIYNSTYTWGWATREQLIEKYPIYGKVYGEDVVENGILMHKKGDYVESMPNQDVIVYGDEEFGLELEKAIYGVSSYDKLYNAFLSPSYKNSVKVTKAELTSNANKQAEYFEVTVNADATKLEFKPIKKDTESNPTVDVASTLTITYLDQYNHTHTIKLPFTVKKR